MGLRLSFGFGPLRFSAPLVKKKRRKSRRQVFHGWVQLPSGRKVKCEHNHTTMSAAQACGNRMLRQMQQGR